MAERPGGARERLFAPRAHPGPPLRASQVRAPPHPLLLPMPTFLLAVRRARAGITITALLIPGRAQCVPWRFLAAPRGSARRQAWLPGGSRGTTSGRDFAPPAAAGSRLVALSASEIPRFCAGKRPIGRRPRLEGIIGLAQLELAITAAEPRAARSRAVSRSGLGKEGLAIQRGCSEVGLVPRATANPGLCKSSAEFYFFLCV